MDDPEPLVRALRADADPTRKQAGQFAATALEGLWRNDHRTVSSVYATTRTILWPWVDPLVATATVGCNIDLDWLLSGKNTLYGCIPLNDQDRLRPVLGGALNGLVGQAFDRYLTDGPLDPPPLVVIDEAATLRPDQLPSWASTVAGIGIQVVTAWQSVAQIDAAYGRRSHAILTNHLTKLFFAGMSDNAGLDYLSRLLGAEHVRFRLSTQPAPGRENVAVVDVPLIAPAALRQIRPGDALMIHGTLPPAHVRMRAVVSRSPHRVAEARPQLENVTPPDVAAETLHVSRSTPRTWSSSQGRRAPDSRTRILAVTFRGRRDRAWVNPRWP